MQEINSTNEKINNNERIKNLLRYLECLDAKNGALFNFILCVFCSFIVLELFSRIYENNILFFLLLAFTTNIYWLCIAKIKSKLTFFSWFIYKNILSKEFNLNEEDKENIMFLYKDIKQVDKLINNTQNKINEINWKIEQAKLLKINKYKESLCDVKKALCNHNLFLKNEKKDLIKNIEKYI